MALRFLLCGALVLCSAAFAATVSGGAHGVVELVVPARADDAAVVPIAIRTRLVQTPARYTKRIYLIVDNNPSPVAATIDLTVDSGRADLETLGRMRLAVDSDGAYNQPARAQLMISHPNDSGLAMDQVTRLYTPAHFVRSVKVTYAGKPILAAEIDFSISENPYFRFYFVPSAEGELKAEAVDTKDIKFETTLPVRRGPSRVPAAPGH